MNGSGLRAPLSVAWRALAVFSVWRLALGLADRAGAKPPSAPDASPALVPDDPATGRGAPEAPPSPAARQAGHETGDMDGRLMIRLVGMLFAVAITAGFGMAGFARWRHRADLAALPPLTRLQTRAVIPPEPHLEAEPGSELVRLHRAEDALLLRYAWTGPDHRRARIPIDRAMALLQKRALTTAP